MTFTVSQPSTDQQFAIYSEEALLRQMFGNVGHDDATRQRSEIVVVCRGRRRRMYIDTTTNELLLHNGIGTKEASS